MATKEESCVLIRGYALRRGVIATSLFEHSQKISDNEMAIIHIGSITRIAVKNCFLRFLAMLGIEERIILGLRA